MSGSSSAPSCSRRPPDSSARTRCRLRSSGRCPPLLRSGAMLASRRPRFQSPGPTSRRRSDVAPDHHPGRRHGPDAQDENRHHVGAGVGRAHRGLRIPRRRTPCGRRANPLRVDDEPEPAAGRRPASRCVAAESVTAPIHGRLFFTRTTGADVQTVFVASGGHERQLTQPGEVCCILRVAPRRGRILVMPGGEIEPPITGGTVNMSGADFSRLALTDPTLNLVPDAWSPDGSRIAFEGWDDADPDRTGIYTAHASDGSDLTRVTTRPG